MTASEADRIEKVKKKEEVFTGDQICSTAYN